MSKSRTRNKTNKSKSITSEKKAWKEFEEMVTRIEHVLCPHGAIVKLSDKIKDKITGKIREVDASIRYKVGTSELLITIEYRDHSIIQDTTWIEQLRTKKEDIGADKTIAVSSNGFSKPALKKAKHLGIEIRTIKRVNETAISNWLFSVSQFEFLYDKIDFHFTAEVANDEDEVKFHEELKGIEFLYKETLWEAPFLVQSPTSSKVCIRDIFENILVRLKDELRNYIHKNENSDTFNIKIKIPKNLLYIPLSFGNITVLEVNVEFGLSDYVEEPLRPINNFKYSNEYEDLINGMEYNIDNPEGEKQILSVHQHVKSGEHMLTIWPSKKLKL